MDTKIVRRSLENILSRYPDFQNICFTCGKSGSVEVSHLFRSNSFKTYIAPRGLYKNEEDYYNDHRNVIIQCRDCHAKFENTPAMERPVWLLNVILNVIDRNKNAYTKVLSEFIQEALQRSLYLLGITNHPVNPWEQIRDAYDTF